MVRVLKALASLSFSGRTSRLTRLGLDSPEVLPQGSVLDHGPDDWATRASPSEAGLDELDDQELCYYERVRGLLNG